MNYIFLDIDGVLNSKDFVLERIDDDSSLDESRVKLLSELVKETDAKIILSSSWRIRFTESGNIRNTDSEDAKELVRLFKKYGISIYGKTKDYRNSHGDYFDIGERYTEIKEYIENNLTDDDNFVIFDDETFRGSLLNFNEHFILTDWFVRGLDETNIKEAKNVLQKTRG